MSWSDEPENEERWHEWEGMLGDASSSIQSLADDFDENESHNVLACADRLVGEVVSIHEAAGVLCLPIDPVIDVAGDADLVARWKEAEPWFKHPSHRRRSRYRYSGNWAATSNSINATGTRF